MPVRGAQLTFDNLNNYVLGATTQKEMRYLIIERQLNIEYIRVVALFVLQKLDLKMMSNFLQMSERWLFGYGH